MKILHIVGRRNNGKTTLIAELVQELSKRGVRVGTVKHCGHLHELDTPGTDSFVHRHAGAAAACVLTPGMTAVFKPIAEGEKPYEKIGEMMGECDVVLVEGDMEGPGPKVEVWRAAAGSEPLANERGGILGVISDDDVEVELPVWPRSRLDELADEVLRLAREI